MTATRFLPALALARREAQAVQAATVFAPLFRGRPAAVRAGPVAADGVLVLTGRPVSRGEAEGRACVVRSLAEARAIEPGLNPAMPLRAAVHLAHYGVGNCRQFAHLLKAEAQRGGADFRFDADVGDELLLLPFEHLAALSPYRASGPVFVRARAQRAVLEPGVVPPYVTRRLMSVRAYDASDMMLAGEVCEGAEVPATLERLMEDVAVSFIHLHNAKRGCFSCRVERVD